MSLADRILYRDGRVIVLDKPAGLACHPGPQTRESVETYLADLTFGLKELPRLAHRLDRDTAGCLVLARTERAARQVARLFSAHEVRKTYWAVVRGVPPAADGLIEAPLLKVSTVADGWRMVVDGKGQAAQTRWRCLGAGAGIAWLEFVPLTGRTHQIRAHAAHLGMPLIGDPVYGDGGGAMQLLARAIYLPLGQTPVAAEAPVPPHMHRWLADCGAPANFSLTDERN